MKYAYPISALLIAIVLGLVGYGLGAIFDGHWFSRFGALVVLFGVAAEYSLVQLEMANVYSVVRDRSGVWNDDHWGLELSSKHRALSVLAHVVVVCGTLTWGFGDLVLS